MSTTTLKSEVKRISDNILKAFASVEKKGGTIPENDADKTSANLSTYIDALNTADIAFDEISGILTITTVPTA